MVSLFLPSSEKWGDGEHYGKYPVKVYTIDGVLIYQADNGGNNTAKVPLGGVIFQSPFASSMLNTIANPITYYGGVSASERIVINQAGHSGDLYNYYWTSYSRGTDGNNTNPKWHNAYLDGYIPLRAKSIYDPCPYLYRLPSNGTYNQFTSNPGWTYWSYLGGVSWNFNTLGESWLPGLGCRNFTSSNFYITGGWGHYYSATASDHVNGYAFSVVTHKGIYINRSDYARSSGFSVRCIEISSNF